MGSPTISETSSDFTSWSALFGSTPTPPSRKRYRVVAFRKTTSGSGHDLGLVKKIQVCSPPFYSGSLEVSPTPKRRRVSRRCTNTSRTESIPNVRRSLERELNAAANAAKNRKEMNSRPAQSESD